MQKTPTKKNTTQNNTIVSAFTRVKEIKTIPENIYNVNETKISDATSGLSEAHTDPILIIPSSPEEISKEKEIKDLVPSSRVDEHEKKCVSSQEERQNSNKIAQLEFELDRLEDDFALSISLNSEPDSNKHPLNSSSFDITQEVGTFENTEPITNENKQMADEVNIESDLSLNEFNPEVSSKSDYTSASVVCRQDITQLAEISSTSPLPSTTKVSIMVI